MGRDVHPTHMKQKTKLESLEKRKKKVFAFNLTESNVLELSNRVGYNSRSKIIDSLISEFVNNKKLEGVGKPPKLVRHKIRAVNKESLT